MYIEIYLCMCLFEIWCKRFCKVLEFVECYFIMFWFIDIKYFIFYKNYIFKDFEFDIYIL